MMRNIINIKLGIPTHLKLGNGETACGLVGVKFAAYDPRDVDCARCMKTKKYREAMR